MRTLTESASHIVLEALQEAHRTLTTLKSFSGDTVQHDTKHLEQAINLMRETMGMKLHTWE